MLWREFLIFKCVSQGVPEAPLRCHMSENGVFPNSLHSQAHRNYCSVVGDDAVIVRDDDSMVRDGGIMGFHHPGYGNHGITT